MSRNRWMTLGGLVIMTLAAQTLPGQSVRQALRAPSRIAPVPDHLRDRGVVRIRAIDLDTTLFDRAAAKRLGPDFRSGNFPRTDMNFFDNASFRVRWTGVDQAGDRQSMVWTGAVE